MCCCKKPTCCKVFKFVIIAIALILAVLVSVWRQESFAAIVGVSRFFDVMLPVLAVGALIKYILGSGCCDCCCIAKGDEKKGECCKSDKQ